MSERSVFVVGCRLMAAWIGIQCLDKGLNAWYLAAQMRGFDERTAGMPNPLSGLWLGVFIEAAMALLLWTAAKPLSTFFREDTEQRPASADISRALIRVLACYFMFIGVTGIGGYVYGLTTRDPSKPLDISDKVLIFQYSIYIVGSILMFLGADRIKGFLSGLSRYGIEEAEAAKTQGDAETSDPS